MSTKQEKPGIRPIKSNLTFAHNWCIIRQANKEYTMNHKDINITFEKRGGTGRDRKDVIIYADELPVGLMHKMPWHQNGGWAVSLHNFGLYSKNDFGGNLARGKKTFKELFANGASSENRAVREREERMLKMVCEFVEYHKNKETHG